MKSIIKGRHYREISKLMNNKFGFSPNNDQIKHKSRQLGVSTGLTGGFKKGGAGNSLDVGSETVLRGYVAVKVAEPNVWENKHKIIWEKANGKVPKGYRLLFADKNKLNVSLDNLLLVSTQELLMMTKFDLIKDNKELTVTGLNIARLILKISKARKRK